MVYFSLFDQLDILKLTKSQHRMGNSSGKEGRSTSRQQISSNVTGVVKSYDDGFGLIEEDDGDRDVSFQIESDNQHLIDTIQVGDTVAFDLYKGPKGYEAKAIKILRKKVEDSSDCDTCSSISSFDDEAYSTPEEESYSTKQRMRGNDFFKSATDNFSPVIRISRLESALNCYKNALTHAITSDEEASATKNIGMTHWKLAVVAVEKKSSKEEWNVRRNFKDALKYFCMAYVKRSCKKRPWRSQLKQTWEQCLKESTDWLSTLDMKVRIAGFSELLGYVPDCRLKASGYIQYSTLLFHEGVTALQEGAYKECYQYMRECYYPIQEAERLCENDSYIMGEVRVLREDVFLQTCIAESTMARATGDDLLEEHLKNDETLNTDTVWSVMDFYTQASVLCRDKDVEQEAIAYSRLGRVYGKVLSLPSRAKDYYKKAIELALSMIPRNFHGVDWFDESTKFVEDFQKRLNKDEEEDKDKKAALKEMKDDVDKLTKMADEMDDVKFVKELYETWPPKLSGAKKPDYDKLSKKKLLLKVISYYHPDKVDKKVHGKNWFYFSQEIVKHLNTKYTRCKEEE